MKRIATDHEKWSRVRRVPLGQVLSMIGLVLAVGWGVRSSGQWLEVEARETIRAHLDAQGLSSVQLQISGRRAHLTGALPVAGDGGRALKVAREATCESWFGAIACVRTVSADFGTTLPGVERWPEMTGSVDNGVLTLAGDVSSRVIRDAALGVAREALGLGRLTRVVDEFRITNTTAPGGTQPLVRRLTRALSLCEAGEASISKGTTSLRCEVRRGAEETVRQLLASPLPAGAIGELRIVVVDQSAARKGD